MVFAIVPQVSSHYSSNRKCIGCWFKQIHFCCLFPFILLLHSALVFGDVTHKRIARYCLSWNISKKLCCVTPGHFIHTVVFFSRLFSLFFFLFNFPRSGSYCLQSLEKKFMFYQTNLMATNLIRVWLFLELGCSLDLNLTPTGTLFYQWAKLCWPYEYDFVLVFWQT